MSLLRDQGMIWSVMFRGDSDYCCTPALPMCQGSIGKWGVCVGNVGECVGRYRNVGECMGNMWECVGPGELVPDLLMMIGNVDLEAVSIGETVGGCADRWRPG